MPREWFLGGVHIGKRGGVGGMPDALHQLRLRRSGECGEGLPGVA